MAALLAFLKPIWTWLLSDLITRLISATKRYFEKRAIKKKQAAAKKKALADYQKAGTSPGLTPEQRAKEIEDAAKKLSDDMRNLPE